MGDRPPARRRRIPLERLSTAPGARDARIDWSTPIDRSKRFYCDTLTPLYYTAVYGELGEEHRRRYNQLTALYSNELIGFLETSILRRTLDALVRRMDLPEPLRAALHQFREDEARHADLWKRLNRLSEPDWYGARDYCILAIPAPARAAAAFVASHPVLFPVVFWFQLVQEERSVHISRRLSALPAGEVEPRYTAVYGSHLRDEVRHVHLDWHLIEHLFASRPALVRALNARIFRALLGTLFLAPAQATARIVARLTAEFPELRPLEARIRRELGALGGSDAYHAMMYSRDTTPITFEMFDRFPEFHAMRGLLRAYGPRPGGVTR